MYPLYATIPLHCLAVPMLVVSIQLPSGQAVLIGAYSVVARGAEPLFPPIAYIYPLYTTVPCQNLVAFRTDPATQAPSVLFALIGVYSVVASAVVPLDVPPIAYINPLYTTTPCQNRAVVMLVVATHAPSVPFALIGAYAVVASPTVPLDVPPIIYMLPLYTTDPKADLATAIPVVAVHVPVFGAFELIVVYSVVAR